MEAAPAVQHRRHLGTDLTTLQASLTTLRASADAVGELDRTVSVDSSIHRVHHPGATAAREDDHPGGRRRRGSGGGRPIRYDRTAYRRRNVVERAFTQLESWRGIAIRYDEHATVFHGAVALASILI